MPDSSKTPDPWRLRVRTTEALLALVTARCTIALVPLKAWQGRLGLAGEASDTAMRQARKLAQHVDRAALRLPFACKCLPRAMALSRMLRKRGLPHRVVIAVRPAGARGGDDDLHAWVEMGGTIVLGDLPGPWVPVLILP